MPITTIIFDLGNVLVKDTTKVLEKHYKFDQLSIADQEKYIKAFHDSEVSKISTKQLLKTIRHTLVPDMTEQEIEQFAIQTPLLPPWKLALRLSKNYHVVIFSNNQKTWIRDIGKFLNVDFYQFDVVNSADIKLRKPHLDAYHYVTNKFKFNPKEAVFVDDSKTNIAAAKKAGWHGFRYQNNYPELLEYLKKLKIKPT